jgi:hypothetical protein
MDDGYAPLMVPARTMSKRAAEIASHTHHPLRLARVAATGVRRGAAIASTRGRMADRTRAAYNTMPV